MNIRLYDSKARGLVDFTPLEAGKVGMYVCGPTVQSSPHIGHLRSALAYDLWRRWFSYRGLDVTFVRNVTDIDDKVLVNASEGDPWWAVAYRVELEFTRGYNALGILPPTYEPRATASIPGMQELIAELIDKGNAYVADDGTGDVFFAVASWPEYGALTNQKPDDMEASGDAETRGKRDPRDFALWKGTKSGEPDSASWNSPWGPGRPGWHIECSAMSRRYLGTAFDIHGGGLDLRFPHHENELAQSTAAGDAFATYWVHNGLVNVDGQKMSKSLGNSVYAAEVLASAPHVVVRYYLARAHYRSTIDFSYRELEKAQVAFVRIRQLLLLARMRLDGLPAAAMYLPEAFENALDDDLNTPKAFAVLADYVKSSRNLIVHGSEMSPLESDAFETKISEIIAMLDLLGINPMDEVWADPRLDQSSTEGTLSFSTTVRSKEVQSLFRWLVHSRMLARAEGRYEDSDRIREGFERSGLKVTDRPDGTVITSESNPNEEWRIEP